MSTPEATVPDSAISELYHAAMSARPFVYNRLCQHKADAQPAKIETAQIVLDALDGSLAEVGQYLGGAS